jgi:beta-barrel assembly-enhancing protease
VKFAVATALLLLTSDPTPAVTAPGYTPQDADERGLWMVMTEEERKLQTSNFVMRDAALNAYVRQVFCRTVGAAECAGVRIFIVRTAYFNASMAPNGMMLVYSGLFLRTRDEAQLAAVLGHEFTHYKNRHTLKLFRDVRSKTNALAWLAVVPATSLAALGALTAVEVGVIGSVYAFSREMESEADSGSIPLLAAAGYDPTAASRVWEQIRAEADATAAARKQKSRKDKNGGMFGTHPPTAERMAALAALAAKQILPGPPDTGRTAFRAALAPFWSGFVDDQIKLNDFGATEFLIENLASEGWTSELYYARGELYRARGMPEDIKRAAGFYQLATAQDDAPAEAWRGLGLAQLRSGEPEKGRQALKLYLARKPDANDKSVMVSLAGE